MKTTMALFIVWISLISFSCAQKCIIKGKVTDQNSGNPVEKAKVTLLKESLYITTVWTDSSGCFDFTGLFQGKYSVSIEHTLYEKQKKENIVLNTGESISVNFKLTVKKNLEVVSEDREENISPLKIKGNRDVKRSYVATACEMSVGYPGGAGNIAKDAYIQDFNTESYDVINENIFKEAFHNPLSTFSIDVDRAAYSNVRRFLNNNQKPVKDAVRIEEMINYFDYNYPQPKNGDPFSVTMEIGKCPWNEKHELLLVGLQGKEVISDNIPPNNLVFLIDVSGSMSSENKLPLLKQAFKILIDNLRAQDRVAIVVYAGAAGMILESTPGSEKNKINAALDFLQAGGSTAGGEGIILAYKTAKENYIKNGNNRVILATDGDFNVGASSDAEMVRLIEEKRNDGIFLTILGFGMGNYKDSKMESISNAGNGNYAYIDNILEAKKIFGKELWGTLFTIAKDVKIQIEFNPAKVKAYRLIGYENRLLNNEDFNNDKKDAGEIGSGHSVTALYEIILNGSQEDVSNVDPLEYQKPQMVSSQNIMTLKLRYKKPDEDSSSLIVHRVTVNDIKKNNLSDNFKFASSVAEFGMILRDSEHKANATYNQVLSMAKEAKGNDEYGYRTEFIRLVETAELLFK